MPAPSLCSESVLATDDLTVSLMKDFQKFMVARHLSLNTISLYNRNLRAVYNFALDEEILKMDKHPFRKVFTGIEPTRKRAVKSDVVRRLIHMDLNDNVKMRFSRGLFLFSIYTQGMAFVDLAHLRIDNLSGQKNFYRRHKTNQRMEIEGAAAGYSIEFVCRPSYVGLTGQMERNQQLCN